MSNEWWGRPLKARRYHIFEGDRHCGSLCGNWMYFNDGMEPEVDLQNDTFKEGSDCKKCAKKVGLINE